VQQSLTKSKDNIVKTFKTTVQEKSGIIQGTFEGGKKSSEWQEFFPHGLDEYHQATMGNIEILISRMVAASAAHTDELGAGFAAIWTTIQTNYNSARSLQQNKKGEVGVARLSVDTSRLPLELQWCKNLLYIGFTYPGDPETCATFFDQSLLKNKKINTNPASGTLLPDNGKMIFRGALLKAGSSFKAKTNTPAGGFWLYSAAAAKEAFSGSGLYINSTTEITNISWEQIGGKKSFLKVFNPNQTNVKFEVEVVN